MLARRNEKLPFYCEAILAIVLILSSFTGNAAGESNLEADMDNDSELEGQKLDSSAPVKWKVDDILPASVNFADMDGDGVLEIIAAAEAGRFWRRTGKVVIIDSKTHSKKREYKAKSKIIGIPAVGKIINDDNWLDIVVACDNGKVYAFDGLTGKSWECKTGGGIRASPVLIDINGDGLMEVATSSNDKYINIINGATGNLLWKCPTRDKTRSMLAAGDLDGDGIPELVATDDGSFVYAIDVQAKNTKWPRFSTAGSLTFPPCIADMDGDNLNDVVIRANDGSVYAIKGSTGKRLWEKLMPYLPISEMSMADVNGDSIPDLLASATSAGKENLYAIDGQSRSEIWPQPVETSMKTAPIVADMDGDGSPEIVVGGNKNVYVLDGKTGKQLNSYPVGEGKLSCSAVLDIDGDGFLDIAAADPDSGSLHILSTFSKGSALWAKMYGDTYNSNNLAAALAYAHDPVGYPRKIAEGPPQITVAAVKELPEQLKPQDTEPPSIIVEHPTDGMEISGEKTLLKGRVTDNEAVDSIDIKVNDESLPMDVASLPTIDRVMSLKLGENVILIEARDAAGNTSEKKIVVHAVRPDLKISYAELPDQVDRGKAVELGLTVTNAGKGEAEAVVVSIFGQDADVSQKEVVIGDLAPGKERSVSISVTPLEDVEGDVAQIMVMARDSANHMSNDLTIPLKLSPPKPNLVIAGHRVEDEDGDGEIEVGEAIRFVVTVQNKGLGMATNVKLELLYMGSDVKGMRKREDIQIEPSSLLLESIPPKTSSEGLFTLVIPPTHSSGKVAFQVKLSDELGHESIEDIELQVVTREKEPIVSVSEMSERWALLIGIDEYRDKEINPLRYAVADVLALKDLLIDPLVGVFNPEKVRVLINDEATKGNILKALTNWLTMAKEEDTVLIYYSGHGIEQQGESYLLPFETDISIISAYGIRNRDFVEALDGIKANKLVTILDSCHSGGVSASARAVGEKLPSSFYDPFAKASEEASGRVTLSSSAPDQQSYEWEEKGHGVFTYYLMEGLRGYADKDDNGVITFDEVKDYVVDKVPEWARGRGKEQLPEEQSRHSTKEIPLAVNFDAILGNMVLDLYKKEKLTSQTMQYAINLLEKHKEDKELSNDEQRAMVLLKQVWDGSIQPKIFEIYAQSQLRSD